MFFPLAHRLFVFTALLACALPLYAQTEVDPVEKADYRVDVDDVISVHVFAEEDLTLDLRVDGRGTISYPFLGEVPVAGLTTDEIDLIITKGLKGDYLINPRVRVSVAKYRLFYVNGEVEAPGAYEYRPSLTVHRAISMAGGFTERAARRKIDVIREKDLSREPVRVKLDDSVGPGDIVTVRESFF